MLLEGYKFANGDISRLTRPQIMFTSHFIQFKIDLKKGKKGGGGMGGRQARGITPAELHAKMYPIVQKQKRDGLEAEIAAANRVKAAWEKEDKPPKSRIRRVPKS
jgi:hypothetical protein